MKKLIWLTLIILPALTFSAGLDYYPEDFQKSIEQDQLRDEELKRALQKVLTEVHQKRINAPDTLGCNRSEKGQCYSQISLGYRGAREVLFGKLHLERDAQGYYVKDVYCNNVYREDSPNIGNLGPKKIPNQDILNCEHTWPQSKFFGGKQASVQKADLHHLFPTESKANSVRGNYEFRDVEKTDVRSLCSASKSDSKHNFEPPDEHKGNVARALFYFATRYGGTISRDQEQTLKRWHLLDPVDGEERERNEGIYELQNNRNPFIDFPELVEKISNF